MAAKVKPPEYYQNKQPSVIQSFIDKHGDRYNYSKSVFKGMQEYITIICKEHGEFNQYPYNHKMGQGCPKCGIKNIKTKDVVLKEFRNTHGDKFEYDLSNYKNYSSKIDITCKEHGIFKQSVIHHRVGAGCPKCANENNSYGVVEFLRRAKEKHGDKFEYDESSYVKMKTPMRIKCPVHGWKEQKPITHLKGFGCISCARSTTMKSRLKNNPQINKRIKKIQKIKVKIFTHKTTEDFIKKAKDKHGDRYDYSESIYTGFKNKVKIICHKHGLFEQAPYNHYKYGCKICSDEGQMETLENVLIRFKEVHGNKFDYSKVEFNGMTSKVEIICPKHGSFFQIPASHMSQGCPNCRASKGEKLVRETLDKFGIEYECQKSYKDLVSPSGRRRKFDFYLPKHNLIIEYDGEQHFIPFSFSNEKSKQKRLDNLRKVQEIDKSKTEYCKRNGIGLLRIPYYRKDEIEEIIKTQV